MNELHITLPMLSELGLAALIAGFIDTLAGGGGLITIPVLMIFQIPPVAALATNKLQASAGTLTSTFTLWRKKQLDITHIRTPFVYAFLGAAVGAWLIQRIGSGALEILIPAVLIIIALYFLLAPNAGQVSRQPRIKSRLYNAIFIPFIGFYDGFFGPGTGSFFSLAEVALKGHTLIKATANAKAFNLASNLGALLIFIFSGKIIWAIGLVMLFGQLIGAYLGSLAVITGGSRLIRPVIVIMCFALLIRYGWQHL